MGVGDMLLHEALLWATDDRVLGVPHVDPPLVCQDPQVEHP